MNQMRSVRLLAGALLLLAVVAGGAARAGDEPGPGVVDGLPFIELVGEDALSVEISLHGALLRTLIPGELKDLAGGLESIHAVILDLETPEQARKVKALSQSKASELRRAGWHRVARVREEGTDVNIFVLERGERVAGLVVMVFEDDEDQFIFTNIAGSLELETLREIGARTGLPGLDELDR